MLKTKIKKLCTFQRVSAILVLSMLAVISTNFPVFAQAVTQGYGSDQITQRGMLIQLKKDDPSKVEAVKQDTGDKLFGVVVDANDAPVTLSSDGKKVFVATAGKYDVMVSTQNGSIKAGDYVTISAIDGIGMKAGSKESFIVGRALSDFDGTVNKVGNAQVKVSDGKTEDVTIGRVQADIQVAGNPLLKAEEPNVPQALRKAAESIAGKPVSAVRIYTGMFVFIVSTIVAAILMYGGVRSAIISIGRNPLGKKSIVRGMFQVIITGLIVFISGVFGVYLLLRV